MMVKLISGAKREPTIFSSARLPKMLSLLAALMVVITSSPARSEVDDRLAPESPTQHEVDVVNTGCNIKLTISPDDVVYHLPYYVLYRSANHCEKGKSKNICDTYVIHDRSGKCMGVFLSGGNIIDMHSTYDPHDPLKLRWAQEDAAEPMPDNVHKGSAQFFITESMNGGVLLLVTKNTFDVIQMKY